jgi:hypothetical protein
MIAFLGGLNYPKRILTLNMETWQYTVQTSTLISNRFSSACAAIKDPYGNNLAIISSGVSNGTGKKTYVLFPKGFVIMVWR